MTRRGRACVRLVGVVTTTCCTWRHGRGAGGCGPPEGAAAWTAAEKREPVHAGSGTYG